MKKIALTALLIVVIAGILGGCAKKEPPAYGQAIANRETTQLKQILTQPSNFTDKTVTLEGKIVNQCPTGCWFDLQEGGAVVHVDINPSGFAIPQKPGKTVLVEGVVKTEGDTVELIGTGVEIQ